MAGGKASPRQKMINMMYLVLTAMLALNVSSEILAAFETIKETLNLSARNAEGSAKGTISVIKSTIDAEIKQNEKKHEAIKDSVDLIHTETKELIDYIDGLSKELMNKPGVKDPKTGGVGRKDETEINHQYFFGKGAEGDANGGRGKGKALELRNKIDTYTKFLADIYNVNRKPGDSLAPMWENYKLPEMKKNAEGKDIPWERYTFDGPIVANFAMLEALKSDIYQSENKIFNAYAARLGLTKEAVEKVVKETIPPEQIKMKGVSLISAPISTIVPAGLEFKTRMYVGIMTEGAPKISSSSGKVTPITDAKGNLGAELTIPASGTAIPAGKIEGKQTYTVTAQVDKLKGGGTETLTYNGEFIVRRPEIVVTSASIQILYRMCGNMVNIDVPALGDLYNPVCTATQAEMKQSGESKKKWLIVPSGKTCVVSVSSNTNGQTIKIGDVNYNVIEPPKPSIELTSAGQRLTSASQLGKGSRVTIKVVPDPEFKVALPQDARYEVSAIEIFRKCGLLPPQRAGGAALAGRDAVAGIDVPVPTDAFACPSGSQIFFELKSINRKNFRGQLVEDKRFTLYELAITVLTK